MDLDFLDTDGEQGASNAILKAVLPDGKVCDISNRISPFKFLDHCPLLYHAFEYGFQSRLQASIEAPSIAAVTSLLRYCYTGSYLSPSVDYAPILLLQHAQTYQMAEVYDVPELQLLAHGNFTCQIDFACCVPSPPEDLLATIRFVYQYYADSNQQSRQQQGLVATLCNYCISNFMYHKLGEDKDFLQVVSDLSAFRQDLCCTNMERNFQDDCAFEIIRLSLDTLQVHPCPRPTTLASRDLPEDMLCDEIAPPNLEAESDSLSEIILALLEEGHGDKSEPSEDVKDEASSSISATTTLAHRPKFAHPATGTDLETDSSSDEDGFSLVHRPKLPGSATPDGMLSSPELIASSPINVLAATGSNYPSDDEWTML